jgi:hypothetical protein
MTNSEFHFHLDNHCPSSLTPLAKTGVVAAAPEPMVGNTQDISRVSIDNHSRAAVGTFHAPVYLGNNESEYI